MPRRVILDTDPGVDDSMALFFVLRSPELQLDAVTTVFGNVDIDQTTRNALIVLDVADRSEVPVFRGADRPLLRTRQQGGAAVHGDNGLGGAELPAPSRSADAARAADVIVDRIMASPGEITLIAVGPLTNVALATRLEPRIVENIHQLIIMGGAATVPGNASAVAEANIHNDPEAAQIVFEAGFPLTMVGLDVTLQAIITPEEIDVIRAKGGAVGGFIQAISARYGDQYARRSGRMGFPMHDSAAVLYAIDPGYFQTERWHVQIETQSDRAAGMVIADRRGRLEPAPNTDVCLGIDADRFVSLYVERLTSQP
jgi:purine nucleosidase